MDIFTHFTDDIVNMNTRNMEIRITIDHVGKCFVAE